jgi:hypothetical protein
VLRGRIAVAKNWLIFFTMRVMGGALDQDVMDAFYSCASLSAAGVGSNVNTV